MWVLNFFGYMYSKFEFCGYSNLWVFIICGCSKIIYTHNTYLAGIRFVGTQNNCWYSNLLVFILKNLLILKFWDTIICGYSKFVGTQNL